MTLYAAIDVVKALRALLKAWSDQMVVVVADRIGNFLDPTSKFLSNCAEIGLQISTAQARDTLRDYPIPCLSLLLSEDKKTERDIY